MRFHNDYVKAYHLAGLQVKWQAYEDELYEKPMGKDFEHEDLVTREGWARYYFKGIFPTDVTYLRMQIKNPQTNMLVKEFYFKFEKSYQTSLDGRFFVKDPVLGNKIVKNGILTELKCVRRKSTGEKIYIPRKTTFKRDTVDFTAAAPEKKRTNAKAIIRTMCRYAEHPKMVFLVTPPHLIFQNLSKMHKKSLANLKICAITCIEIHEIYTEVTAYGASAMLQHNKSSLTKPPRRSGIISGKRSGEAGHAVIRARRSSLKTWSAATRRW